MESRNKLRSWIFEEALTSECDSRTDAAKILPRKKNQSLQIEQGSNCQYEFDIIFDMNATMHGYLLGAIVVEMKLHCIA